MIYKRNSFAYGRTPSPPAGRLTRPQAADRNSIALKLRTKACSGLLCDAVASRLHAGHAWLCSLLTGGPWMLMQRAERVVANASRSHASCSEAAGETTRARPCVRTPMYQRWQLAAPHSDVAR